MQLSSRVYIYQDEYFDQLEHDMLDPNLGAASAITGFEDETGYYIVIGMKNNVGIYKQKFAS